MKLIEPKLSDTAKKIAEKRYLMTDMDGKVTETTGEMLWRVAMHLAKAEINWGENGIIKETAEKFYERMVNLKFMVAGKALFEAGNPGGTGQLSSCFVLPIEDSIAEIFKTLGQAAVIHKNNGGTGFNFSKIRVSGDKVKNVPKAASGPVDFLGAYSAALGKILQGSKRQGANIGILNCDHGDIIDFIKLKEKDGTIKNFNISVGISNKFMEAVEQDKDWQLKNPRNGAVVKTMKAKKLFELIATQAWETGDPGLAFLDRMNEDNPTPSLGKIEATNPCGEITLLPYESCNLTSIILSNHLKKSKKSPTSSKTSNFAKASLDRSLGASKFEIDWQDLEKSVKIAVQLLDDMIEVNTYALTEIEAMVKNGNRRIGVGVMGFAHLLYRLQIPYGSNEAVRLSERLAKFIRQKAEEASLELGEKRGTFPNWDISIYASSAEKYRNCALCMIAPTGTISMLCNCSSGIEPVFSLVTKRRTFFEDDKSNHSTHEFLMTDPILEQYLIDKFGAKESVKILSEIADKGIKAVENLSKEEKAIFVSSHEIAPKWHIKIQAAWQKYFDNSVSKTINFPNHATVEDVKKAYMMAWKLGCKGITIYRDGSKEDQVLSTTSSSQNKLKTQNSKLKTITKNQKTENTIVSKLGNSSIQPTTNNQQQTTGSCPECGSALEISNSATTCLECGWSQSKI